MTLTMTQVHRRDGSLIRNQIAEYKRRKLAVDGDVSVVS